MVDGPLTVVFQPTSANTGGIQGRLDDLKQLIEDVQKSVADQEEKFKEQREKFNKELSDQGKELKQLRADHEELVRVSIVT